MRIYAYYNQCLRRAIARQPPAPCILADLARTKLRSLAKSAYPIANWELQRALLTLLLPTRDTPPLSRRARLGKQVATNPLVLPAATLKKVARQRRGAARERSPLPTPSLAQPPPLQGCLADVIVSNSREAQGEAPPEGRNENDDVIVVPYVPVANAGTTSAEPMDDGSGESNDEDAEAAHDANPYAQDIELYPDFGADTAA